MSDPRRRPLRRPRRAPPRRAAAGSPLRIGIGGPVGSGKTALVAALCRTLGDELSLAVVTNDIYTTEDADFLRRNAVLPDERIAAVQTGCCPHTAIRDDITANLDAIEDLIAGTRGWTWSWSSPAATTSPRRSRPGWSTCRSSWSTSPAATRCRARAAPASPSRTCWSINKTDLGADGRGDLRVMADDAARVREGRPTLLVSLREDPTAAPVAAWVREVVARVTDAVGVDR